MAEEIRITKKLPRKGDDGYRIVSVRMKETLLERLDALSAKSNRSRNELINLLLESAAFVPMVIMLLFWCVVRITYITIVMRIIHEIQYIYMAYPITWSLSSIVYFLYYHFSDWVHGFDKQPKKI